MNSHRNLSYQRILTAVTALVLGCIFLGSAAHGQPSPQICGDGTTFTVNLPGRDGLPNDYVTLPKGCRIYALLVSGYSRNKELDELTFYKLAKVVAENGGYVHWAWWNNLLKEYMARPLHERQFGPPPTPGALLSAHILGFVPNSLVNKAQPEEDFQFQDDAKRFLKAIKANNPNATIVVAGHSMGGDAVVRLGANPDVPIDLLAPIDPVGNRSSPVFDRVDPRNNWTRWRVADPMLGWQQRDCIRNRLGGCKNFGTVRNPEYRCAFRQIQDSPPIRSSREPRVCPGSAQLALDPNPPVIGNNVRFLYLRWQKESAFPFDFGNNIQLRRTVPLNNDNMREGNYQKEVSKNGSGVQDRNKTCSDEEEIDPRDPYINCNSGDGHGEIVGFRGFSERRPIPYGLQAQNWPLYFDGINANLRRQKLIEMATAPSPDPNKTIYGPHNWEHEPLNPNLDLVVDDLVTMLIKHINENQ